MYQFNQKIKRMPLLTKKILDVEREEELFAEAVRVLTSEEGLDYQDATFLLQEGDQLRVVLSTCEPTGGTYPLGGDNRFSRFLRGGLRVDGDGGPGILVPLHSRGRLFGLYEVISHPKEKVFFDESSMLSEWQEDVLLDIGCIIAIVMDNLRLNREIKRQSILDPLTQVYNRHYFIGRLRAEAERARRYGRTASVIFVDVDHFKQINDEHGHLQGDQVLRDLSRLFEENLREVDVVCRFGGDEFVILLPETDLEMACRTATKLLKAVESTQFRNVSPTGGAFPVTISVGVSTLRTGQTEDDLLQMADAALYKAKTTGRNRYAVFSG
jgi:diguanylate cyclase (GGDEF)-like protein